MSYLGLAEVPPHWNLDRIGNGRLGAPWWKEGSSMCGSLLIEHLVCFGLDLPWCSATTYTAESTSSCLLELPGGCHSRDVMGERLTGVCPYLWLIRMHHDTDSYADRFSSVQTLLVFTAVARSVFQGCNTTRSGVMH